jgi:hypothetical protein
VRWVVGPFGKKSVNNKIVKAIRLPSGATYYAQEHNALRSDAVASSWLHVHQQLGALALGTTPTNGQTVTLDINGTNVQFQAVTGSPTNPGDVKAPGTAAGFVANLFAALQNLTVTTSTYIALSAANAQLVQYLGYGLATGGTTLTLFSLNTSTYSPLTSFSASTTVTSGSWTAQTMELYVQPGTYYVGTTRVLFLGGSTPTFTAPVSHPRIDLVTADSSGTIALVTGTENVSPSAPAYPSNKMVLAEIYNAVGETALYDNDNQQSGQGYVLNDVRPFFPGGYISSSSQIAPGVVLFDPGSDAQGDIYYWSGSSLARLPAGIAGYVLQTQGASANPQWVLSSTTAQIKDVSGPNITPNADNTFHTIATYTNIPAINANQTIWLRGRISNSDSHSSTSRQYRIQMNGTTIFTGTGGNSGGNDNNHFDVMVIVPTPASSQTYEGIISGALDVYGFASGSVAANLSSAFSITVQYLQNSSGSPAMNGAVTLTFFEIIIFN